MTRVFAILLFSVFIAGCASSGAAVPSADQRFLEIAKNPSEYDGKTVTVRAWISLRHEDKNLWATWKDHENWETTRCISLVGYDKLDMQADVLDGKYVEVVGVLRKDASNNGNIIRLGSCRDIAIEIEAASSVRRAN